MRRIDVIDRADPLHKNDIDEIRSQISIVSACSDVQIESFWSEFCECPKHTGWLNPSTDTVDDFRCWLEEEI